MFRACFLFAIVVASASAASIRGAPVLFTTGTTGNVTNVCNMNWNYCPRDEGCVTYTMSAHEVTIHANNYVNPVKAEDLKSGDQLTVQVKGETSLSTVPSAGSYRIYDLAGHNGAEGVLSNVMSIDGSDFTVTIAFTLTDAFFVRSSSWFEFGLDIFQEKSGSDEAMCLEFSDNEYLDHEKSDPSPPFEMYCVDDGNGHFTKKTHMLEGHPITSESCTAPPTGCDLKYYYCPRDPGCKTYDSTVDTVVVDVHDSKALSPGDTVHLQVNGTTQMHAVPVDGSLRIYDLAGHNMASATLTSTMTLYSCKSEGCGFGISLSFVVTAQAFDPAMGFLEFGLDVFRESSGTLESFCIEIANPAYVAAEEAKPTPSFDTLCKQPAPYGHWTPGETPEVVRDAVCHLV